jgi:protocatechuate 3,4-dioxygenase beta subunit
MKLLLVAFALVFTIRISAQDPAEKPAQDLPAKAETCTVEGVVVAAATGEPLKAAKVRLFGGHYPAPEGTTDALGHFAIAGVPAGDYHFRAGKLGYIEQTYHPDSGRGPGKLLTLAPGQKLDKVQFRLVRAGVIMGRLTDEAGEPFVGARVEALLSGSGVMFWADPEGSPMPEGATMGLQFAVTNDLGEYRLNDLPPGRYYLRATDYGNIQGMPRGAVYERGRKRNHPTLYYPGVTNRREALQIRIGAGQETHIDLSLRPEKVLTVSGRLLGPNGSPAVQTRVTLRARDLEATYSSGREHGEWTNEQGNFEFKDVFPGSYAVTAELRDEQDKRYWSEQPVEVSGENVSGLRVRLRGSVTLSGKITRAGDPAIDLHGVTVCLQAHDSDNYYGCAGKAEVKTDGAFTVQDINRTTHRLHLTGLADGWYLHSAFLGGQNVLDDGLKLAGGVAGNSLEITVSPGAGQIEGVVLRGDDPIAGATVRLTPDPANQNRKDLYRGASTGKDGHFIIKNVVPGSYRAVAVDIEGDAINDDDDAPPNISAPVSIVVAEKESKTVQIKLDKIRE